MSRAVSQPRRPPPLRRPKTAGSKALAVQDTRPASIAHTTNTPALTPKERLAAATRGETEVRAQDIQALLCGHLLDADKDARHLGRRVNEVLEMLFSTAVKAKDQPPFDPMALLDMVRRISRLQKDQLSEIRRTAELMHKLGQPSNPAVQIVAATEQINVTAPREPDPGRFRRPR